MSDWPKERVERLRELWSMGLSGATIGRELGVSRCSVLGKVRREKLPFRTTTVYAWRPSSRVPKIPKVGRKPDAPRQIEPDVASQPFEFSVSAWEPLPGSAPVTLEHVTGCRWPVGDPFTVSASSLFCNCEQVDGRPYCWEHERRASGKGTNSERHALRTARTVVYRERRMPEFA